MFPLSIMISHFQFKRTILKVETVPEVNSGIAMDNSVAVRLNKIVL